MLPFFFFFSRPQEISSKQKVPFLRKVVPAKKAVSGERLLWPLLSLVDLVTDILPNELKLFMPTAVPHRYREIPDSTTYLAITSRRSSPKPTSSSMKFRTKKNW